MFAIYLYSYSSIPLNQSWLVQRPCNKWFIGKKYLLMKDNIDPIFQVLVFRPKQQQGLTQIQHQQPEQHLHPQQL